MKPGGVESPRRVFPVCGERVEIVACDSLCWMTLYSSDCRIPEAVAEGVRYSSCAGGVLSSFPVRWVSTSVVCDLGMSYSSPSSSAGAACALAGGSLCCALPPSWHFRGSSYPSPSAYSSSSSFSSSILHSLSLVYISISFSSLFKCFLNLIRIHKYYN